MDDIIHTHTHIMYVCVWRVTEFSFFIRTNMSLTSILSADAIEKAVKDCQGK